MRKLGRVVLISGLCVALIALLWQVRDPCPKSIIIGGMIMAGCRPPLHAEGWHCTVNPRNGQSCGFESPTIYQRIDELFPWAGDRSTPRKTA
jgi:hypothetical protein